MHSRAPRTRRSLLFVAALCAAAPAAAFADQVAGSTDGAAQPPPAAQAEKEEEARGKGGFDFDAELEVVYTSNVFREQARRLDNFDSDGGQGERFEGMEGPADLYAQPALEIAWSRKIASGRRLKLSAGAELTAFARNSIANYFTLEAAGSHDLTRHDRVQLEVELIPRRFKENYFNDVGGNKVFDEAVYRQVAPTVAYRREWSKRWSTELEYELTLRRFEDPFAHRDTTTHTLLLLLARELSDRVTVKAGPELALARVDNHMEFGADVNRSHRDVGVVGALELNLRHGWAGQAELEYKHKSYLSEDPADDAHFERADNAFDADLEVEKRLSGAWYLTGVFGFTKVLSNRSDPSIDADEVGYTELVIGAGGAARF